MASDERVKSNVNVHQKYIIRAHSTRPATHQRPRFAAARRRTTHSTHAHNPQVRHTPTHRHSLLQSVYTRAGAPRCCSDTVWNALMRCEITLCLLPASVTPAERWIHNQARGRSGGKATNSVDRQNQTHRSQKTMSSRPSQFASKTGDATPGLFLCSNEGESLPNWLARRVLSISYWSVWQRNDDIYMEITCLHI